MTSDDLHRRRLDAVRAWTSFVELGDDAEPAVRPEILRSWELSGGGLPDVTEAPLADEDDDRRVLADSPLQTAVERRRGRAAAHRRGRRPGHRRHRRRDPHPVDLRRPGDATQGRDRQLRARRPVGRGQRRHQRARHRRPHRRALDGLQCRALRRDGAQLGVLGGARCTTRSPASSSASSTSRRPGTARHPIGLATARVMARLIETRDARRRARHRRSVCRPPRRARTGRCRCSAPPRRGSTASGCCSTVARPRSSPCSALHPAGSLARAAARPRSTATSRSPPPRSRPRSPTSAPPSAASSPRAPTG